MDTEQPTKQLLTVVVPSEQELVELVDVEVLVIVVCSSSG